LFDVIFIEFLLNLDVWGVGIVIHLKTIAEIGFLEIFHKPPNGHARPARRHKW